MSEDKRISKKRGRPQKQQTRFTVFQDRFREEADNRARTLPELSEITGITRQSLGAWKNGDAMPSIEALKKISQSFGVSADYLLGITDTPTTDKDVRGVSDFTGLSEDVVENLNAINKSGRLTAEDIKRKNARQNMQLSIRTIDCINEFLRSAAHPFFDIVSEYLLSQLRCQIIEREYPQIDWSGNLLKQQLDLKGDSESLTEEQKRIYDSLERYIIERETIQPLILLKLNRASSKFLDDYTNDIMDKANRIDLTNLKVECSGHETDHMMSRSTIKAVKALGLDIL